MVFNAQSPVLVIIPGRNAAHLIMSPSLFTVTDISRSLFREELEKMKVNEPLSRLETLAAGKACYARCQSAK